MTAANSIELTNLEEAELPALAEFLARENAKPERHVPYVGMGAAEIAKEIRELPPLGIGSVVVGRLGGEIVAAIAVEADAEVGRAWLRGPFAPAEGWQPIADRLLEAALARVPEAIGEVELSGDERHRDMASFAERHGFRAFGHSHLMELTRADFMGGDALDPLPPSLDRELEELHTETFPRTYYTARQLREMVGPHKALLGIVEHGRLAGYTFVEVSPTFDSADVHFLVVHPDARGRGLGRRLLRGALHWHFGHPHITRVGLVVRSDNPAAIAIYRAAGFVTERVALGWRRARLREAAPQS